ncbi:hypothetical protein Hanom_Chr04g00344871 [Helianthus anomalus]
MSHKHQENPDNSQGFQCREKIQLSPLKHMSTLDLIFVAWLERVKNENIPSTRKTRRG